MVWGHGARFVQVCFGPKFGYLWVQFGLELRFLLIFVKNLYPPGDAMFANNHKFLYVFWTRTPSFWGLDRPPKSVKNR